MTNIQFNIQFSMEFQCLHDLLVCLVCSCILCWSGSVNYLSQTKSRRVLKTLIFIATVNGR